MKDIIKKLKDGTIYLKPHASCAYIDVEAIDELMKEAAEALDELSKKHEPLSDGEIYDLDEEVKGYVDKNVVRAVMRWIRAVEKEHGIGVSDE